MMSEHKIQSGHGKLSIEMGQVPKILKPIRDEWTPEAFIVSFKLETDMKILVPKARTALERYGHQVVIGNELHRRKFEVVFVSKSEDVPSAVARTRSTTTTTEVAGDGYTETWLRIPEDGKTEIEEEIIAELVRRHLAWTG